MTGCGGKALGARRQQPGDRVIDRARWAIESLKSRPVPCSDRTTLGSVVDEGPLADSAPGPLATAEAEANAAERPSQARETASEAEEEVQVVDAPPTAALGSQSPWIATS
jgi:hypothetical protein